VRTAALAVASAAARRREGAYQDVLADALNAGNAEQRRLAFSAVRSLPDEQAQALFQDALAASPEADARRELLAEVTSATGADRPSAQSATSVLANKDISPAVRDKARTLLRRAFSVSPEEAAVAAAELAADTRAAPEDRVLAMELLHEYAPKESYEQIRGDIKDALDAQVEAVKAAALPLYARIAPDKAGGELAVLQNRKDDLSEALRVALALAWGEVARINKDDDAAHASLDQLLEDKRPDVRAAAARAYGYLGRGVQNDLVKMVKNERYDVALGAAHGLVNSVEVGGSNWATVSGLRELWKKKGPRKRDATRLFARMARTQPAAAYDYLRSAANDRDDPSLHVLGVEGLCNGLAAGHKYSRYQLQRAAGNDAVEVRRLVIQCVVDNPDQESTAVKVALDLADDPDQGIRAEAAKVLAQAAADGKVSDNVAKALAELAADEDTAVRIIAIRALGKLGDKAPKGSGAALTRAFDRADEAEKLAILETARAIGAGDLAAVAMSDGSPLVRIAGIDTAIELGAGVAAAVGAALTDKDPAVRRATLERLGTQGDKLPADDTFKGLSLATRDPDPGIREVALTTLARVATQERVIERLSVELASRSEQERARAASAAIGLVDRDPTAVAKLLAPLLDDPSHDVRRALLPSLAAAYAALNSDAQLAEMLRGSERDAMKRLVTAAAFITLARTESGRDAALARLGELAENAGPLVRLQARMTQGLIGAEADGIEFLAVLVP
jgi:HEAT repeat protein